MTVKNGILESLHSHERTSTSVQLGAGGDRAGAGVSIAAGAAHGVTKQTGRKEGSSGEGQYDEDAAGRVCQALLFHENCD